MNPPDRLDPAGPRTATVKSQGSPRGRWADLRGMAPSEWLFLGSLPLAVVAVIYSGTLSFKEGQRLEGAKANAMELAKWAEEAGAKHEKGEPTLPAECSAITAPAPTASATAASADPAQQPASSAEAHAPESAASSAGAASSAALPATGAVAAHAASAASAPPSTWAKCKHALVSPGGPLAEAVNTVNPKEPVLGVKCERDKPLTRGQVVVEKGTSPPPGISGSVAYAAIEDSEPMVKGLMLKILVCDKGSYAIKVLEVKL